MFESCCQQLACIFFFFFNNANLELLEESDAAHFVWKYFAVTNNTDARKGCTKNAVCMFCDKCFSGYAAPEQKASFFYEKCISSNIANSLSFACMIEESMKCAKQNLSQSYEAPSRKHLSGDLLDQVY